MNDATTAPAHILDELLIRRQVERFADAAMACDGAAFAAIFDPPANARAFGRADIAALLGTPRRGQKLLRPVRAAETDHGRRRRGDGAQRLLRDRARGPGEHFYRNHGMFFDRLVRTADGSPLAGTPFQQLDVVARNTAA